MVDLARQAQHVVALHDQHVSILESQHEGSNLDEIDRGLEHQNHNPVKVISSGKEQRIDPPFYSSGKWRYEKRVPWWQDYDSGRLCIFGHYSNYRGDTSVSGQAICADFAVAKRWQERNVPSFDGTFRGCLGAIRIPENCIVLDNGDMDQIGRML